MKLLDSTVAIDHLRGEEAAVALVRELAEQQEPVAASELTRFEVLAGALPDEQERVERLFSQIGWIPVEEPIVRRAAALVQTHRPAYPGLDDVDYLIAATALEIGAELLTANVRHFPMFPDLRAPY